LKENFSPPIITVICVQNSGICFIISYQLEAVFLNLIDKGFVGSEHVGAEGLGLDTVVNLCSETHENQEFFVKIFREIRLNDSQIDVAPLIRCPLGMRTEQVGTVQPVGLLDLIEENSNYFFEVIFWRSHFMTS
jgi:hypothetical protein